MTQAEASRLLEECERTLRWQIDREPLPGMMVHQNASSHERIEYHLWDRVNTMDDATSQHLLMFFCDEKGMASSFHDIGQMIACHGLFSVFYTDRGSHYFHMPEAGGKTGITHMVDANRYLKQVYSPQFNAAFVVKAAAEGSVFIP